VSYKKNRDKPLLRKYSLYYRKVGYGDDSSVKDYAKSVVLNYNMNKKNY